MKLAFVNKLTELALADPRVVLLTGDLGFGIFDDFAARCGQRYVNVGVAEALLVDAAAGLAHAGCRPVTYSIASFMTARCFEQIKLSVAYAGLPVVIVGAGGGYAYASSGVTHHAGEDLALMGALPGMTVVAPGDAGEVEQLLPQVMRLTGPAYFRIGRGREPRYDAPAPPVLGQARLLQPGERLAVLSTGTLAGEVVAALRLLAAQGIRPVAYQLHTVKPLDCQTLAELAGRVEVIVTVEEHVPAGGLGGQVALWLARQDRRPRLVNLSVPDQFVLGSPHPHELRSDLGLDANGIAAAVARLWQAPRARAGPARRTGKCDGEGM